MTDLTWVGWLYVIVMVGTTLYYVATVGRPRKPNTGLDAAVTLACSVLWLWGLFAVGYTH